MKTSLLHQTNSSERSEGKYFKHKNIHLRLYPELPPPAYTESKWGAAELKRGEEEQFTGGDWQFVPRYVTYNSAT